METVGTVSKMAAVGGGGAGCTGESHQPESKQAALMNLSKMNG